MSRRDGWPRTAAAVVAAGLTSLLSAVDAPPETPGPKVVAEGRDNTLELAAREAADQERAWSAAVGDPAAALEEFMRSDRCPAMVSNHGPGGCMEALEEALVKDCGGEEPVPPLWRRERASVDGAWSPWDRIALWSCPQDVLPPLTQTDFRSLPIAPSVLNVQPASPQVLVNMPTIVFTDPTTQTFTTTLLGYPVDVEATPTRFTWDFGDGSAPLVTTSPGRAYPDQDVSYPYAHVGTYTITLTTEFTGRYRVGGTSLWLPVAGTATTTTTSGPIEAVEAHSHLVTADCIQNPHGPYC